MANEAPKIARIASETVSNATAAADATTSKVSSMADAGTAQVRGAMERGMEQASKAAEGSMKAAQDFAEFSRGNVETLTQVTQTWMTGSQEINRQAFALMQGLADHAMEGIRALSGVKSLKEAAEIQATYARGSMEKVMSETAKLQEASFRLVEQVATPMTQRVSQAVERATKQAAA